ncbi:hypothetical protein ACROYT_G003400 [Oculina patagonica]
MTGGNLLNRPKTALQKNLNKLTRVKKAQKKKQQQKSKGPQQSRAGASVSAKKKRLIMKQIKRQQKEENAMEVIPQPQSSKKSEGKAKKESKTEKMDIS